MKKFIVIFVLTGVTILCMYSFYIRARLSHSATSNMTGNVAAAPTSTVTSSTGNACIQLQDVLKKTRVVSTYLSLRQQNFEEKDFGQSCSLTYDVQTGLKGYVDLAYSRFNKSKMLKVNFYNSMLNGVQMKGTDLTGANLKRANAGATPIVLEDAILNSADASDSYFYQANMKKVQANGARFVNSKLKGADVSHGKFQKADFSGALMTDIIAVQTDFSGANFSRATMSGNISGAIFTNAQGVNNAAFMNLYYYTGHPPVGLPEEVMKKVTQRSMPANSSITFA